MNNKVKTWYRIRKILQWSGAFAGLVVGLFALAVCNPSLSYANSMEAGPFTIYYNEKPEEEIEAILMRSLALAKESELFDIQEQIDICLADGSYYPQLMEWIKGKGVAYTIMNKVTINCDADFRNNAANWSWAINQNRARQWRLDELIAHELIHAFQYNDDLLMPLKYPAWKIEGYAEYISRKKSSSLLQNLKLWQNQHGKNRQGLPWIVYPDGTGTPALYFEWQLAVQYLMDEEMLTYHRLLKDTRSITEVNDLLMDWYDQQSEE